MKQLVKMLRPQYLPVVLGPQYLGFVLAGRQLLPEFTLDSFPRFAIAMIALGPLLWCGTVLLNDCCDISIDRYNLRHSRSPLVRGEINRRQVLGLAIGLKASALVLATLVSPGFFLVLSSLAILSWLYSAKPFRLKGRPGLDVMVNAVGFGALCTLSGWAAVSPLQSFPWLFLLPLVLGWASLYVPTTMVDVNADRRSGVTTFTVRFGLRSAFWVSLVTMVVSILLIFGMALFQYVLTPEIILWTAPVAVLQIAVFWRYARQLDSPDRIYEGTFQAAILGLVLEIIVVLHLSQRL